MRGDDGLSLPRRPASPAFLADTSSKQPSADPCAGRACPSVRRSRARTALPRRPHGEGARRGQLGSGMPRPIWNGSISFGLVQIPVGLYPAEQQDELSLTMLDRNDMPPVGYDRINKQTGEK